MVAVELFPALWFDFFSLD